jgi:hypothetical protein
MSTSLQSSVEADKARFNTEASAWDANKKHVESVEKAFEAIKRYVPAFQDGSSKSMMTPKFYPKFYRIFGKQ